jgi:hypothetical protein
LKDLCALSPRIVLAIAAWELAQIRPTRNYSEGSFFWRERRRWRFAWREKQTHASLCFGLCFDKALTAYFERRISANASIPGGMFLVEYYCLPMISPAVRVWMAHHEPGNSHIQKVELGDIKRWTWIRLKMGSS